MSIDDIRALLRGLNDLERHAVLQALRHEFRTVIHPLELAWNTTAEAILEAIHSAPDLTQRGVRGILAEATFRTTVVPEQLTRWRSVPFQGERPYDVLLDDSNCTLKIQVKNQRRERGSAKIDNKLSKHCGFPVYVVETQRTRNGQSQAEDGSTSATRPYRFGDFDVLAVCLQPSSNSWKDFIYCPAHLLLPRPDQPTQLKVMQPIFCNDGNGWTRDFEQAAESARLSGKLTSTV